ncbi:YdcF family protein [Vibrio sp. 404]|uniref:YdcF family protein n=2 Tax=Vibrio marinisediminis TaxID=2758441 RepID=A0A7W2FMD6_9VIBR|nr:YdcF family protein [Vibrio marinisediminis]MBA5760771.1 YdcF family protein [Vibrio marinisediminis]
MDETIENVTEVVVVLGKRLVDNQLTAEGRSRIETLARLLPELNCDALAVIFCGGRTPDQEVSEAQAMLSYLTTHFPKSAQCIKPGRILLEDRSTTTIENIANASAELIESRLCVVGSPVTVRLLSNDYHIERIIEIERLMPEQGLLNYLKLEAHKVGLELVVSLDEAQHIVATYPNQTSLGKAFLLVDQLTTYRVYLEGRVAGVFQRSLMEVREQPYQVAVIALEQLLNLPVMRQHTATLLRLREIIEQSTLSLDSLQLEQLLVEYNQRLLALNRSTDPEN